VLFVGPFDLTHGMGISGQFDHPRFREAVDVVAEASHRHGKAAGILLPSLDDLDTYWRAGYRFLACSSDGGLLRWAAATQLVRLRDRLSVLDR